MRTLLIIALGGLLTATTWGQTTTDSDINTQIRAFNDLLRTSAPPGNTSISTSVPLYSPHYSNPNDQQIEQNQIQQAMDRNHTPEVTKAGNALIDAINADVTAHAKAQHDAITSVLNRIHDALQNAQKPEDLDQLTKDLGDLLPGQVMYGDDDHGRLNEALPYVDHYQDYLAQIQSGNTQQALQTLHNMEDVHVQRVTLLPRSFIQEKIAVLEKQANPGAPHGSASQPAVETTLKAIHSVDDVQSAAEKMTAPGNQMGNTPDAQRLKEYASLCAQAKNGLPVSFTFAQTNYGYGGTTSPEMARIQSLVVLYLLPLYLGAGAPAPNPDETVIAYLDRLTSAAESTQNWPLLQRVVMARIKMQAPNGGIEMGAQSFLTGLSQEIAGQYELAVASYQAALRSPDDYTPTKVVGDRLDAIKKDHPAEYERAMQSVSGQPPAVYFNSSNGRIYRSRGPVMNTLQTNSALTLPIESDAAKPSKKSDSSPAPASPPPKAAGSGVD